MVIDSWVVSNPNRFFTSLVIYENALALGKCGIRKDWNTDIYYDLL